MKPGHHVILILVEKEWAAQENQSKMEFDEDLEWEEGKKVVTKLKDELEGSRWKEIYLKLERLISAAIQNNLKPAGFIKNFT